MKLDDLLSMGGVHQLATFTWGPSAVILLNSMLTTDLKIDVTATGDQAREAMRKLPAAALVHLLTHEVAINGAEVSFALPTPVPAPLSGPPTAGQTAPAKANPIALFLIGTMVVIGLALTFSTVRTAQTTGQMPDTTALQHLITAMTDLAKHQSPAPASPSTPADTPP